MSIARMPRWSLRLEQAEVSRLAWAFAISLAFHLLVYGGYHTGKKYHLWQNLHWPAWLQPPKFLTELIVPKKPSPRRRRNGRSIPLMFVNVNPAQATAEAPKDAKFYSDKNSRAANPEADKITEIPKIDGKQPEIVKTEDVPRQKFTPLQPSPPRSRPRKRNRLLRAAQGNTAAPRAAKEAQAEAKPKPAYTPGDLTLAKPSPTPRNDEGDANEAKPARPRTIKQALAQLQQKPACPARR